MPKWSSDSIQIQHLLKLNSAVNIKSYANIDSNTTFVKVKFAYNVYDYKHNRFKYNIC